MNINESDKPFDHLIIQEYQVVFVMQYQIALNIHLLVVESKTQHRVVMQQ